MDKENEEKKLIRKLKEGDEKSLRVIYLKYHEELYTVAVKYLRNKELAEDAVHDVFVKLWDNRDRLDQAGSLSGFLFTAIENHVLNMIDSHRRKMGKQEKLSKEKEQDKKSSDFVIRFSEYQKVYEEAIDKLPSARRKVFLLRMKEGLTNQEVAEYLEISIHTVKSQFYKASKFVRNYVSEHADKDTRS